MTNQPPELAASHNLAALYSTVFPLGREVGEEHSLIVPCAIVQDVLAEVRRLRAALAEKEKRIETLCLEWAEDDTSIKAICAKNGINVDGDRWGFKGRIECMEELSQQLAASQQRVSEEAQRLKELLDKVPEKVLATQRENPSWSKAQLWGIERDIVPSIRLEIWSALATPAAQAATEETQ